MAQSGRRPPAPYYNDAGELVYAENCCSEGAAGEPHSAICNRQSGISAALPILVASRSGAPIPVTEQPLIEPDRPRRVDDAGRQRITRTLFGSETARRVYAAQLQRAALSQHGACAIRGCTRRARVLSLSQSGHAYCCNQSGHAYCCNTCLFSGGREHDPVACDALEPSAAPLRRTPAASPSQRPAPHVRPLPAAALASLPIPVASRSGAPIPVTTQVVPASYRRRATDGEIASYRRTARRVLNEHEQSTAAPAGAPTKCALRAVASGADACDRGCRAVARCFLRRHGGQPLGGKAVDGASAAASSAAAPSRCSCRPIRRRRRLQRGAGGNPARRARWRRRRRRRFLGRQCLRRVQTRRPHGPSQRHLARLRRPARR